MKIYSTLLSITLLALPFTTQAKDRLDATVINSPVKETYLKVRLDGVDSVSSIHFKPKNGGNEVEGEVIQENGKAIGKFRASHLKPGSYEYRIKVRTQSGSSNQHNAASVEFITFKIDSSLEVADPGEEGKKTSEGVDSDKDGVRDDVQRWVLENYYNKPSTKQALFQTAKDFQNFIIFNNDKEKIRNEIAPQFSRSTSCLAWVSKDFANLIDSLEVKVNNTESRVKARLEAETKLGGYSPPEDVIRTRWEDQKRFCSFKATKE